MISFSLRLVRSLASFGKVTGSIDFKPSNCSEILKVHSLQRGYLSPPFQIIPPLWSPLVGGWWDGKGERVMRWQFGKGGRVVRRKDGWFYSRVGNTGRVQDFIFLFLMLIKGTKGQSDVNQGNEGDGLKIFLCACRDGKTLLRSSTSC